MTSQVTLVDSIFLPFVTFTQKTSSYTCYRRTDTHHSWLHVPPMWLLTNKYLKAIRNQRNIVTQVRPILLSTNMENSGRGLNTCCLWKRKKTTSIAWRPIRRYVAIYSFGYKLRINIQINHFCANKRQLVVYYIPYGFPDVHHLWPHGVQDLLYQRELNKPSLSKLTGNDFNNIFLVQIIYLKNEPRVSKQIK